MLPRGLPNRSKIDPRWLPGGSRAPPESANESGGLAPLFGLFGGSRGAPGSLLAAPGALLAPLGPCLAPPGALLGTIFVPGASFGSFLGLFPKTPWKIAKTLKTSVFSMVLEGFWPPRGIPNRARITPKSLLPASCHLLALTWRVLGVSWRPHGAFEASWASLGPLLKRF